MGESFRPVVPVAAVRATYAIAGAYVLADSIDKGAKEYEVGSLPTSSRRLVNSWPPPNPPYTKGVKRAPNSKEPNDDDCHHRGGHVNMVGNSPCAVGPLTIL